MSRSHPSFEGCRCLVTGASSGLGRALTLELLRQGAHVLGTGRSAERLDAVGQTFAAAGGDPARFHSATADLTSATERDQLLQIAAQRFDGTLDLVVQSAGVGAYGRFVPHDPSILRTLVEVNFLALAEVARGVFPMLRRGKNPAMVAFGSIVARRGLPGRSEYAASKFAVAGLIESIRPEWAHDNIHVLLVNPGFTRTEFEDHLLLDTTLKSMRHKRTMPPERVVAATLRAIKKRKPEIALSFEGRLLLGVNRLAPRFVHWGLARWTDRLYAAHRIHDRTDV